MLNILSPRVLLASTGSIYAQDEAKKWQRYLESRIPLVSEWQEEPLSNIDVRTPLEHLENIRTILNPPISELAIFFDVSRQAIYKWLAQEASPESDRLSRIIKLSKIADAFKEARIQRAGALLNMKVFDDQSLFDLLKSGKPHESAVQELILEAKILEESYIRSGLSQSNAESTNDWRTSISIPAYQEEN